MPRVVRLVALLCVASCVTVAAVEVWPAGRGLRTADQNGDGRADVWRLFDGRGQLTEIDVDSNFDGSPDIQEFYQRGALVRRESDRNFNGQTDLVEEFDPDTHGQTRSVVDVDYDGTADLLVLFRDGHPVFSQRACASKRSEDARRRAPAPHGVGRLVSLTDPFESDSSLRALRSPSIDDDCAGVSTSGGLPRPRTQPLRASSAPTRVVAGDARPDTAPLPLSQSPRAPPVS